jgi:hypothetical protein
MVYFVDTKWYYLWKTIIDDPVSSIQKQSLSKYVVFIFLYCRYPVILSIENHCSLKQQRVMVDHMTAIFGDKLYCGTIDEKRVRLPSPEDLKGKILIKVHLHYLRLPYLFQHLILVLQFCHRFFSSIRFWGFHLWKDCLFCVPTLVAGI